MALAKWFGWFGRGSAIDNIEGTQNPVPSVPLVDGSNNIGLDSALQISTVWACLDRRASTVASLPFFVYRNKDDGQKVMARTSSLYQLLHDAPNPRMTPMDFWRAMMLNHDLRGNAYARLDRNPMGEVIAMWPMPADQVEVEVAENGKVLYYYRVGNDLSVFAEESVLHLKNLGNGTVGLSKLDFMRATTDEAAKSQTSASKTFGTGGKPTGVLMVDSVLKPEQREKIKQNFAGMAEGNTSRLFLLEANMKYQQLSLSPEDQQLLETRRFGVEEICRWYDVPPVLAHHSNVTTWGSGIEQIVDGFYKLTIRPMLVSIEQAVRKRVMTSRQRASMTCEFGLDALLRGNPAQRAELYSSLTQNGIMTRNEARQLENLPPMTGADELTVQSNLIPLTKLGQATTAPAAMESDDSTKYALMSLESKMDRLAEPKQTEKQPININVTTPDIKAEFRAGDTVVHLPTIETKNEVNVPPTTVNVAAPDVKVENLIEPTPIQMEARIENLVDPQINVIAQMPARKSETTVQRDAQGNIVKTTQVERDA